MPFQIKLKSVLGSTELQALLQLWNAEYPRDIAMASENDLADYLSEFQKPRHHLYYHENGELMAWYCLFEREQIPWFVIIISRKAQGSGLGSSILRKAQMEESLLNGWAVEDSRYRRADGSIYPSPLPFYIKNGFRLTGKKPAESNLNIVHILWP